MNAIKTIISSITGLFLALVLCIIPMKEDALVLSVKEPVTRSSTEIVLVYENKTGRAVSFCEDQYEAERKTETGWVAEPRLNRAVVREIMTVLQPNLRHWYTITLTEPLDAGEYRISNPYCTETYSLNPPFEKVCKPHTAVTEFTVS